ncbi:11876_t:CDS:2, partial [Ambispora leptoticha]
MAVNLLHSKCCAVRKDMRGLLTQQGWVYKSIFACGLSLNLKMPLKQKNTVILQSYSIVITLATRYFQLQNVWNIGRVAN